jgi:regulator of protease activity HflC (stomatin/prohibitin superfamily)
MEGMVWAFSMFLLVVGGTVGSTRRISEGNEALVERLGRYHRKLKPGLNFGIIPLLDEVVSEASIKEQVLDIDPIDSITRDNVRVKVDPAIYWRIMELQQAFYAINDVEEALTMIVSTTLRAEIGRLTLEQTNSARDEVTRALLKSLDEATEPWGVKVTRVEIQDIKPPDSVIQSLERERAAESNRRAVISEAEGRKKAAIQDAEAIAESVKAIAKVLPNQNVQDILKYLVAQKYVEANLQLGQSDNSKIVFMNPREMTESISRLVEPEITSYQQPRPKMERSTGTDA